MGIVFGKTGVKEPVFDVLMSRSQSSGGGITTPYELRRYGTRFAVETEYLSSSDVSGAFRRLAAYIGVGQEPQNEGDRPIQMTAPVVTTTTKTTTTTTTTTTNEETTDESSKEDKDKTSTTTSTTKKKGKEIAMTAPVVMQMNKTTTTQQQQEDSSSSGGNMNKMQFILPDEYNHRSKIPNPTNPNVWIKEIPPAMGAVHQFDGWVDEAKVVSKMKALVKQLRDDGMKGLENESSESENENESESDNYLRSKCQVWQFNPPFTLPQFRRNEIWMELTQEQVDKHLEKFMHLSEREV